MAGQLFPQFPEELAERIIELIPANEVACTVRLLGKAFAAKYRGHSFVTVKLSQPVPHHAFQRHFGQKFAGWPYLILAKRVQLLCLTAASGDLDNLELAVRNAGCVPSVKVLEAAARAGHLHTCQWLRQRDGFRWDTSAVTAGMYASLRGGHVGLMDWFLQQLPDREDVDARELLAAAAEGCDLATLQRLHGEWWQQDWDKIEIAVNDNAGDGDDVEGVFETLSGIVILRQVGVAAGSPTPDWRAKVEWLETELGDSERRNADCSQAAALPDAVDRLQWLRQRGYPLTATAACAAAASGNLSALQYLLGEAGMACADLPECSCPEVARGGHLAALQALHAHGYRLRLEDLEAAAEGGHLAVVAWLVEQKPTVKLSYITSHAARSGSVELLTWLHERGRRWTNVEFEEAVGGGCEAALTSVLDQGCPMPTHGHAYFRAAINGDLATLRCLRRLGCPWGSHAVFTNCVSYPAPLAALRWLLDAGCPMDWDEAVDEARWETESERRALAALLSKHRRLREGAGA